jgi:hypothetical protein
VSRGLNITFFCFGLCCSSFRFFFVFFYYVSLCFEFRVVMSVTISVLKRCSVCHLHPVVCRSVHVLFTLCFPGNSGVQHIFCCVFCFRFLCLVYPYDASLSNVYCYIIFNDVSLLRCLFNTKIILMMSRQFHFSSEIGDGHDQCLNTFMKRITLQRPLSLFYHNPCIYRT